MRDSDVVIMTFFILKTCVALQSWFCWDLELKRFN